MSQAWETTVDDVITVLAAHGLFKTRQQASVLHDGLDHEEIEANCLGYADMDDQTNSMLDDIEDQLLEVGVIPAGHEKKFTMTESIE